MRLTCRIGTELRAVDLRVVLPCAAVCLSCGMLSAFLTGAPGLFKVIELPAVCPPGWVFAVVWTVLYPLIGGAAGVIASAGEVINYRAKGRGLLLFIVMFVFNLLWYPIFFGVASFFTALLDALIIAVLTAFIIYYFWKISRCAALVMTLYLAWIIYAIWLNVIIILSN